MTTDQPLDLDAIDAVADAATPGPWTVDSSIPYGHRVGSSDEADWVAWTGEHGETGSEADAAFIAAVNPVVALALGAEVRRLRVELERRTEDLAFLERTTLPELRREIEHHKAGKQRWRDRAEKAEAALTAIRHLHKDSPMGPCPVCIDADAIVAGGDGLMPYPCPTGRLAGAQDCDPPHVRAARYSAAGNEMAASLVRDGFGDDEIADILARPAAAGSAAASEDKR